MTAPVLVQFWSDIFKRNVASRVVGVDGVGEIHLYLYVIMHSNSDSEEPPNKQQRVCGDEPDHCKDVYLGNQPGDMGGVNYIDFIR